jgi:25S rRNA (uracil2634-N3)-methyltransferase
MSKRRKRNEAADEECIPIRECHDLYTSQLTLDCARSDNCIVCAYKIGCFDVALDTDFVRLCPNQRPEQCPRSAQTQGSIGTLGYGETTRRILSIGDGDLTFSLALARMLSALSQSAVQPRIVATSYESQSTLLAIYPGMAQTIQELEALKVTICYNVDGTRIKESLPISLREETFDRVVWNFPCTAALKGQDGQNAEMDRNKTLVREFVAQAPLLLTRNGQIHINHKTKASSRKLYTTVHAKESESSTTNRSFTTKPPFNHWKLDEVALEQCTEDVYFLGRVAFDRCLFPPYIPRKALHHKSFPSHDACTYIFGLTQPNGLEVLDAMTNSCCQNEPSRQLVRVTRTLILALRQQMLSQKQNSKRIMVQKKRGTNSKTM